MANPPPPYADITGISRTVMKDNAQETLANYNGNARPGEIVADLTTDPPALYIGNNAGQLTAILGGGGGLPLSNGDSYFDIPVASGNVEIGVDDAYFWIFDTNGTLATPGDITVAGDVTGTTGANTLVLKAQPITDTYIQLNSIVDSTVRTFANLEILTDSSNTAQTFVFGTDGVLTVPGNVRMGNINASAVSQINTVANSSGDGNGYTTLELIPDENLTGTDQYLIIDPTAPGHIHIRAGGTQDNSSADLFLGGEYSHLKVAAGANSDVVVRSNSNDWTFDSTGNLTIPGSSGGLIKTVANASIGIVAIDNGTDNPAQLMSWNVFQPNPSTIISAYANSATIMTDVNGTPKTWTFSNTGNLSAPGNISSQTTITTPLDFANLTPVVGGRAFLNNANLTAAGNFGANVSGGGSNVVPVWSDGTNWYIG